MSAGVAKRREAAYLPDIAAFESGAIDVQRFDHRAHLHVAWCYLREYPLAEAIMRFTAALRALTVRVGAQGKYHETVSWFFMVLIADRMAGTEAGDWEAFGNANGDLLSDARSLLRRHYSDECLASESARRRFVLPDRAGTDRHLRAEAVVFANPGRT